MSVHDGGGHDRISDEPAPQAVAEPGTPPPFPVERVASRVGNRAFGQLIGRTPGIVAGRVEHPDDVGVRADPMADVLARAVSARRAAVGRPRSTVGNRAAGMLLRDFQLPTPWLLGGEKPRARPGDELRVDPDRKVEAEAVLRARLEQAALLEYLSRIRLGVPRAVGEPEDPGAVKPAPPAATAPTPAGPPSPVPPVAPFTQTKPGEASDLMDAFLADPAIVPGVAKIADLAVHAHRTAPPGERRLTLVSLITLSAVGVGSALVTPGGREILGKLSGIVVPVPGQDWFSAEFNSRGDNHIVGLHFELGPILGEKYGFGPAGPGRGPAPMTPPGAAPGNF